MRLAPKISLPLLVLALILVLVTAPAQAVLLMQVTGYPADNTPLPTQPGGGQEAYPTQGNPTATQESAPATNTPFQPTLTRTRTLTALVAPTGRTSTPAAAGTQAATFPAGTPNRLLTEQAEMQRSKGSPPASETPLPAASSAVVSTTPITTATIVTSEPKKDEGRFFSLRWSFFLVGMLYALILGCVSWLIFTFVRKKLL
jgi:hypothetical protein